MLRARGRTLAVLGPNESGKTSLLEALESLGNSNFPGATAFTDRQTRPATDIVLSARFVVEEDDVAAVKTSLAGRPYVGDLEAGLEWNVNKRASGERRFDVLSFSRDPSPRSKFVEQLSTTLITDWDSLPHGVRSEEQSSTVRSLADDARKQLAGQDGQVLEDQVLGSLSALLEELDAWASELPEPHSALDGLREDLRVLVAEEQSDLPGVAAGRILFSRMPAFIRFDDAARILPSFTPFSAVPPASLVNLLAAADSTFEHLATSAGSEEGRDALVEEERRINLRLEELFKAWSQREVTAAIRVDPNGIEVLGRDRAAPIIDPPLSQHSVGMATFAALVAFLHAKDTEWASRPVLLVDEAEMHLHYDAQADLVRVFDTQDVAQTVIYTTHSIGCLPEDLGLGLVVVEECGSERSRLSQAFWTRGPGITPVMVALGATALSFTPARRVIIGEGAHEAILLPSLLRQARTGTTPLAPLGFQVVGGLAEISASAASRLEEEAGTVLYLIDNDDGGDAIASILPTPVRESGRVLKLGEGTDAETIEDFISAEILVTAIDDVCAADRNTPPNLSANDVPATGRAAWAVNQLIEAGSPDARTRLAQASVLAGSEVGLVEPARKDALQQLLAQIESAFPDAD
jgi:hypothetical protein